MTEIINIESVDGPGDNYHMTYPAPDLNSFNNIMIDGRYIGFNGDIEMECTTWTFEGGILKIET